MSASRGNGAAPSGYWKTYGADLANHGYRAMWVPKGRKRPLIDDWQLRGVPSANEIAEWGRDPGRGICLVLGEQGDGTVVVAIDVDIRDPKIAGAMHAYLRDTYGLRVTRYGQRPKFAVIVRVPSETRKLGSPKYRLPGDAVTDKRGHHVEVLATGQQIVIYATHPDTGKPYEWEGGLGPAGVAPSEWPLLTIADVEAIVAAGKTMLIDANGVEITPGKPNAEPPREDDPTRANPELYAGLHALLAAAGLVRKPGKNGIINIECPFIDAHGERPTTGTVLMSGGGIKCHHASCEGRTIEDYIEALKDCVDDADSIFDAAAAEAEREAEEGLADVEANFAKTIGAKAKKANGAGAPKPEKPNPTTANQRESEWGEPFDILGDPETGGAPTLRPHHIPDAIAPFVFDVAARIGADPSAVAMSALTTLATVVTEDWCIQPRRLDTKWLVTCILWTTLVGDSSVRKSPILKVVKEPLEKLEADAALDYDTNKGAAAFEKRAYDAAVKNNDKDIHIRWPNGGPKPLKRKRYIVNNTTVDALTEVLRADVEAKFEAPAKKVLVFHEEMSEWVASFDRYNQGGGDRPAYLRLRDGGPSSLDRIIRGSYHIPSWAGNFLGGIQPDPIRKIATTTVADGLLPRFVIIVSERLPRGVDRVPNEKAIRRYETLFPLLAATHPTEIKLTRRYEPVVLHDDARQYFDECLAMIDTMMALPDVKGQLLSALGKWDGLWAQLALLFHLIDTIDQKPTPRVVAAATAKKVTALMRDILLPHLLRADALMFKTEQSEHVEWIAGHILARGLQKIALRDIVGTNPKLRGPDKHDVVQSVMKNLEALGWLRDVSSYRKRHSTAWLVNPMVHDGRFARVAEREKARRDANVERLRAKRTKRARKKRAFSAA